MYAYHMYTCAHSHIRIGINEVILDSRINIEKITCLEVRGLTWSAVGRSLITELHNS